MNKPHFLPIPQMKPQEAIKENKWGEKHSPIPIYLFRWHKMELCIPGVIFIKKECGSIFAKEIFCWHQVKRDENIALCASYCEKQRGGGEPKCLAAGSRGGHWLSRGKKVLDCLRTVCTHFWRQPTHLGPIHLLAKCSIHFFYHFRYLCTSLKPC